MKILRCVLGLAVASASLAAAEAGNYVESFDTIYNSLTIERNGSVVELRARSRRGKRWNRRSI